MHRPTDITFAEPDHLPILDANPGKFRAVRALVHAFRREAPGVAADQRRRFFDTGRRATLGAARVQMLCWQVVRPLEGFVENRANFRDAVTGSSLPEDIRDQLLVMNCLRGHERGERSVHASLRCGRPPRSSKSTGELKSSLFSCRSE